MYDRKRDYLKRRRDRRIEEDYRRRRSRDGYMHSNAYMYGPNESRHMRDYSYDYARTRRSSRRDGAYNVGHYIYDVPEQVPHIPVEYIGYDGSDNDLHEYKRDLEEWEHKLKHKDIFNLPKHEVIKKAKDMGVSFEDFDEDEFYTMYLAHLNIYPNHGKDPHTFIAMTRAFMENDCLDTHPEERVCKYLYHLGLDE